MLNSSQPQGPPAQDNRVSHGVVALPGAQVQES